MEKASVDFDSLPSGRPLQGKMALAIHPLSCQHRRMFGSQENEREGKKIGRKGEKWENMRENGLKAFALKFYSLSPLYSACLGGLIAKPLYKLQKKQS